MLRNVQPRKNGPPSARERTTGRNTVHHHGSTPRCRKQPQPKLCKLILTRAELARTFFCAFCGETRPESDLTGRDGALLFCGRCVDALEALHHGTPIDVLALLRGNS